MKSAREIVCTVEMGDCGAIMFLDGGHSAECDACTEAIQQAREDGAQWAIQRVVGCLKSTEIMNDENFPQPADVRKEAP